MSINVLVFSAVSSWLCRAVCLCLAVCVCLAALCSVDVTLSGICRGIRRASKRHSVERHVSRVSTHFRDQSRPIASISAAYCACQFPCWATPAASSSHSHTLHIHTRFTLSHASHSHTLYIHTRDSLFESCRMLCLLISVLGNTGSVKFTFTHALVKGLRRCTSYLL